MAVPLEKRCAFLRCQLAGLYVVEVKRQRDGAPMSSRRLCLDHRDLFETVFVDITAGRTVHLVPKKAASQRGKAEPVASAAVAGS